MPAEDAPTAKKIQNMMKKLKVEELEIKNEHELELVVWGLLCGRWADKLQYRREVGGRLCDITISDVAVEIKYVKRISDKDRCIGQVLDYSKQSSKKEIVVIAIDHRGYMKDLQIDSPKVTIIRL